MKKQVKNIYSYIENYTRAISCKIEDIYKRYILGNDYGILMRLDKPTGYLLTMLPSWWVVILCSQSIFAMIFYLLIFFLGAVLVRAAGSIINDIMDIDIDKKIKRTRSRPLASGKISIINAVKCVIILLLLASLLLPFLSLTSIKIALFSIIPITIYPLMKRVTYYPQIFLGFTFNLSVLIAWFTLNPHMEKYGVIKSDIVGILMYFATVFWTIGYDTIYGHQDKKDDIKLNVKSLSLKLGDNTKTAVWHLYKLVSILIFALAFNMDVNWMFYPIFAFATYMLYWQVHDVDIDNPKSCAKYFRYNVNYGFVVSLAMLVGRL